MNEPSLSVRVENEQDGKQRVLSPEVGFWSHHPSLGTQLGPGSPVGFLRQLNRRFSLVLPLDSGGRLEGTVPSARSVPVEYGQLLFELAPVGDCEADRAYRGSVSGASPEAALTAGTHAVIAPTDGVFYRRPSPGAKAFIEVGSRLWPGQPIGLVEVMKTFNQILYGGPGLPDEAEVVEVRCGDAEEIRAGQILVLVR